MNQTLRRQLMPILILCFIGYMFFNGMPILMNIIYSLTDYTDGRFVGLQNYSLLFYDELFRQALYRTGIFLGLGIPIMLVLAYVIGMLLVNIQDTFKWAKLPFLMSILLPTASITYTWNLLFGDGSFIGEKVLGINTWVTQSQDIMPIILLYTWKNIGYCILIFLVGWTTIPKEVYEAAQIDGANGWEKTRYITMPLMVPFICGAFILALVQGLKIGRETFILYGEYPKESIYMIHNFFRTRFIQMDIGTMSSAAVMLEVLIGLLLGLLYYGIRLKNRD